MKSPGRSRPWVDFDAGDRARDRRDHAWQQWHAGRVQGVGDTVGEDRMHARPGGEDLGRANTSRSRVPAVSGRNVTAKLRRGAPDQPEATHRDKGTEAGRWAWRAEG